MTTVDKPALPQRIPTRPTAAGPATPRDLLLVYFSFNNTVDPDWTPDPGDQPISRKERRIARTAAANERGRHSPR